MANLIIKKIFSKEQTGGSFLQELHDLRGGEITIRAIGNSTIYFFVSLSDPQKCFCNLKGEKPFHPGTNDTFCIKPGQEIVISGFINLIVTSCSPTGTVGYEILGQ